MRWGGGVGGYCNFMHYLLQCDVREACLMLRNSSAHVQRASAGVSHVLTGTSLNPLAAPACKISGLNDARTRLQTVYFPVL